MAPNPTTNPADDEVRLQFVAALDEWVALEHALDKLFYVLLKPIPYPRAASLFASITGFQAQREAISALSADAISDDSLVAEVKNILDRARSLTTKRNRLVHGVWRHHDKQQRGQRMRLLFRFFIPPVIKTLITGTGKDLHNNKGKYVFFLDDLVRCEIEFRQLKADIDHMRHLIAEHRKVDPNIEIPVEEVRLSSDPMHQPSSRPPKTS